MQDPNTPQRFPATDEQENNPFVTSKEHEDIVFEENEKEMDRINNHFERSNENHWEDRVPSE